ncbi:Mrp family chromosome partitioning ATPase [Aliiruegeria haliotis]|uniref:Mrp family chromosome partitioning ATPase n=1 Tax=Aliiruegeria haliotis TaxID=1280846 RepID=A0A2T0RFH0_9RHOB|nr:CpsD/CapB family tyrosine-protein kinase [Aliiruegeria haliotis]PRY19850.1 Mrp family chromosome partitioning ATPase [Aliiruegeria haliotis]
MEKLQAALAKAREKRESLGVDTTRGVKSHRASTDHEIADRWSSIRRIDVSERKKERGRLVSLNSNKDAAAFDVLRTKVLKITAANGWRRIAVTSPAPGSGKTTTSINLAVSLSRQPDLRIMLMDLDMRRPALAKALGQREQHSVEDFLNGRADFPDIARRLSSNLILAMNHKPYREASDLFLREQTAQALDRVEADYQPDYMVFDMPPMLVNDDTAAFLGNVDCVLMIAEAGVTTIDQIDACERELASQTNVLGVVLNKCRPGRGSNGYYYDYGY